MSELLWPWALLALPLPWLLRRLLPPASTDTAALRLPFYGEAATLTPHGHGRAASGAGLALVAWLLLCIAAARPQWVGETETLPQSGRDLLLAVDVSGSMAAEDMQVGGRPVNRLMAVQIVLSDFLTRRVGDRVGLILFGQQAYLLTPLTFDLSSVRYQLQSSAIGDAGRETAIGDAIGIAVKRLRERPQQQRVLILLTDGVNTAGSLTPLKAAELARDAGVRVYTVGVGSDARQSGMLGMMFAQQPAEIDEKTLTEVAEMTGGRYFRARDTRELAGIYGELDRLEPAVQEGEKLRPRHELFMWPLAAALLAALLIAVQRLRSAGGAA